LGGERRSEDKILKWYSKKKTGKKESPQLGARKKKERRKQKKENDGDIQLNERKIEAFVEDLKQ